MADTVPAMLEPGEFVIRKDAVDEIGVPALKILNQADRIENFKGGGFVMGQNAHSSIDELIALNSLQKFKYGGKVKKDKDSYMEGGKVMKGYMGGGMVKDKMMGYQKGGEVTNLDSLSDALSKKRGIEFFMKNFDSEPKKQMYQDAVLSGEVEPMDALLMMLNMQVKNRLEKTGDTSNVLYDKLNTNQEPMQYQEGGKVLKNLKQIPEGNPGLKKLPQEVRNKMGYMQEGGEVLDFDREYGADTPLGAVDKEATMAKRAAMLPQQLQLLMMQREKYDSPKSFKEYREKSSLPTNKEVMEVLSYLAAQRDKKMVKGYQTGGYVGTPTAPTLDQIFGDAGDRPTEEAMAFYDEYDPTEQLRQRRLSEQQISNLRDSFGLGQRQASERFGGTGFYGGGTMSSVQQQMRESGEASQRSIRERFADVARGMQEDYELDILGQLQLDMQQEATEATRPQDTPLPEGFMERLKTDPVGALESLKIGDYTPEFIQSTLRDTGLDKILSNKYVADIAERAFNPLYYAKKGKKWYDRAKKWWERD
tara:strand:+ start:6375 stop:7979 length:1605 start_codon:yes stop_codon:yes gene_type:complete